MFSLIITIISIALVAALALATIYYGGSSFNKGSNDAAAAQRINEGQQINGAIAMAKADVASGTLTTAPADVAALAPDYLAQVPAGWLGTSAVTANSGVVTGPTLTAGVCGVVNTRAGLATAPADIAAAATAASVYGCTAGNVMFYKF